MKSGLMIIFTIVSLSLSAQSPKQLFAKAESLYKAGKFEEALAQYKILEKNNYSGKDLYYNMGNCYFKLGEIGYSIVCYEKAAKYDPADKDIAANLRLANSKTEDKINNEEKGLGGWFNRFIHVLSPDTWTKYGVFLWIFAFVTFLMVRLNFIKKSFEIGAWTSIVVAIVFLLVGFMHYKSLNSHNKVVITQSMVQVKSSPSETAKDLYILHEGAKINLHQVREQWYEISIDNENYGWVQKTEAEMI